MVYTEVVVSLQDDLGKLLVRERVPFNKALTVKEWNELTDWCTETFGAGNWFISKSHASFSYCCPEGSSTLFLLRWS
jgi:hypothetical protein